MVEKKTKKESDARDINEAFTGDPKSKNIGGVEEGKKVLTQALKNYRVYNKTKGRGGNYANAEEV